MSISIPSKKMHDLMRPDFEAASQRTFPLTLQNMPKHLVWEDDGACWRAEDDDGIVKWCPRNNIAARKGRPNSEMGELSPTVKLALRAQFK